MLAIGEKFLIKLWDSLTTHGIAGLLAPWQMRRVGRAAADARRYKVLAAAQAEVDADAIRDGKVVFAGCGQYLQPADASTSIQQQLSSSESVAASIASIASRSAMADGIRKEIALAEAVLYAEEELKDYTGELPNAKPSDDWMIRWRDHAGSVCSNDLQEIWGRVLAGEMKNPGTYSLRTLTFLRDISQEEAILIQKLAPFVMEDPFSSSGGRAASFVWAGSAPCSASGHITLDDLLELEQIGILSAAFNPLRLSIFSRCQDKFRVELALHEYTLVIESEQDKEALNINVRPLTYVGHQVVRLCSSLANREYLHEFEDFVSQSGFRVIVRRK